jgi:cell shape-determining protein MreD
MYLFAFQLPLTLVVGALLYFGYSMQVHDQPRVDLVVAIILGVLIDVVLTAVNKRDEKRHQQS